MNENVSGYFFLNTVYISTVLTDLTSSLIAASVLTVQCVTA